MKIALIGGHGKVALRATPALVAAGHEVISVIRNPAHRQDVEAAGATAKVVDIETLDQLAWNELLSDNFDAVIWSAGAGGGDPERTWNVDFLAAKRSMVAAARAGVPKYLMVSFIGASLRHQISPDSSFWHYAQAKAEADTFLRGSGLTYLILGPSTLTLDDATAAISPLEHSETAAASDNSAVASTSRGNVALAVAAAVDAPASIWNRTIDFTDGHTPIAEVFS